MSPVGRDWMTESYCRGKWHTGDYESDNRGGRQEESARLACAPCKPHVRQMCARYHIQDLDTRPPLGVVVCGIPVKEHKDSAWIKQVDQLFDIANGAEMKDISNG